MSLFNCMCSFHISFFCLLVCKYLCDCCRKGASDYFTSVSLFARSLLPSLCMSVCHVHSAVYLWSCFYTQHISAWACHLQLFPLVLFCHMFVQIFFSASATCVVAMFLCLYISEHLLFQQGPHGLKCQSKQLPDKCIVQQACVSPPPIPPLLVLWC